MCFGGRIAVTIPQKATSPSAPHPLAGPACVQPALCTSFQKFQSFLIRRNTRPRETLSFTQFQQLVFLACLVSLFFLFFFPSQWILPCSKVYLQRCEPCKHPAFVKLWSGSCSFCASLKAPGAQGCFVQTLSREKSGFIGKSTRQFTALDIWGRGEK